MKTTCLTCGMPVVLEAARPSATGYIHGQLPPPLWMPTLCPSLRGSGLGAAEVGRAILEVHELQKSLPAPYHEPQVIRAMILQRLEALLHEGAPQ